MFGKLFKRKAAATEAPELAAASTANALIAEGNRSEDAGDLASALRLYRQAVDVAPTQPETHLNLGIGLVATGELQAAMQSFRTGLALEPGHAFLSYNYADALYRTGDYHAALEHVLAAMVARPDFLQARLLLANTMDELGEFDAAVEALDQVLRIDPNNLGAHINRVNVLMHALNPQAAESAAREALGIHPDITDLHWNLALSLLIQGRFEEGWTEHEWRPVTQGAVHIPDATKPQWQGEDLRDKSILLFAEFGLGDAMQFLRFALPVATRAKLVIVQLQPALCALARASLPSNCVVVGDGVPVPHHDFHFPLLSLPYALGTGGDFLASSVPYLAADPARVEQWRKRLASLPGGGRRVGLVWSGNPAHQDDKNRSMALSALLPLRETRCTFVSLQPAIRDSDRPTLAHWPELALFGHELRDFADTAALVSCLDLVVSVDTSVAHLAGAMGKPLRILLPHSPDWRWMLDRSDTPWYPSAKLLRQPARRDWKSVVELLASKLVQ